MAWGQRIDILRSCGRSHVTQLKTVQALIGELCGAAEAGLKAHADTLHSALSEQGASMQAALHQALQTLTPAVQAIALPDHALPLVPGRPTAAVLPPVQVAAMQAAIHQALQALQTVVVAPASTEMPAIGPPAPDQPPASLKPQPKASAQQDVNCQQALQALLSEPALHDGAPPAVTHWTAPPNRADAISGSLMHQLDSGRPPVTGSQTGSKQRHKATVHPRADLNGPAATSPVYAQQSASLQKTPATAPPQQIVALLTLPAQPTPAAEPRECGGSADGPGGRGAVVVAYVRAKGKRNASAQSISDQAHDAGSAAHTKRRRLDNAGTGNDSAGQQAAGKDVARKETAAEPSGPAALAKATTQRKVDKRVATADGETLQVVRWLS